MKRRSTFLYSLFLIFFASFLSFSPALAAIDSGTLNIYSQNNILFYDPTSADCWYSGSINVYGDTIEEKIWTGLTSFMTPEQAAGVMGNMAHEGSFNPAMHEIGQKNKYQPGFDIGANSSIAYGLGLIQWSFGRRINLVNYVKSTDASLMSYLENYNTYSPNYSYDGAKFLELAGDDVTNRLIAIELQFLKDELDNNDSYSGIYNQNSVYDAAKYFLEHVERPRNPYIGSHPERATDAQKYYDALHSKNINKAAGATSALATDGANVTIIGDSLTVRATNAIHSDSNLPKAEIVAKVGGGWDWGINQLSSITLRDNVVFALGTNNTNGTTGTLTESQIEKAISIIGTDKNIFFVTNYSTKTDYSNNNSLLKAAANKHSNVYIIDWYGSASADPSKYLDSDGLHESYNDGINLFADLIRNGVLSNVTTSGCSVSGELANYVLAYAWPEHHNGPFVDRMPAYAEVVAKRQQEGKYVGGSVFGVPGIDCGGWVTTLLNESGFEPEYNSDSGGTGTQESWVQSHGWTRLNPSGNIDTSTLQPGDVAFTDGHTWVYVGEINGFETKIASASYATIPPAYSSARAPMAGYESYNGARWYRKGAN